jgi:hypothetical protein
MQQIKNRPAKSHCAETGKHNSYKNSIQTMAFYVCTPCGVKSPCWLRNKLTASHSERHRIASLEQHKQRKPALRLYHWKRPAVGTEIWVPLLLYYSLLLCIKQFITAHDLHAQVGLHQIVYCCPHSRKFILFLPILTPLVWLFKVRKSYLTKVKFIHYSYVSLYHNLMCRRQWKGSDVNIEITLT